MASDARITMNITTAWNGPVCNTCGAHYFGSHMCNHDDIVRRINELMALLGSPNTSQDATVRKTDTNLQ